MKHVLTSLFALMAGVAAATPLAAQQGPERPPQAGGRMLTWAGRPAVHPAAQAGSQATSQGGAPSGLIPHAGVDYGPSTGVAPMPATPDRIARSGLTPASVWLPREPAPRPVRTAPAPVAVAAAPTLTAPAFTTPALTAPAPAAPAPAPRPVQPAASASGQPPAPPPHSAAAAVWGPAAPAPETAADAPHRPVERAAALPAQPASQAPAQTAPAQPAPAAEAPHDPMAPRPDAPIFRIGRPASGAQDSSAPQAPAAANGGRYYSVHRQNGRQPDAVQRPEPVYLDGLPVEIADPSQAGLGEDLGAPPAPPAMIRDADGRMRPAPAAIEHDIY